MQVNVDVSPTILKWVSEHIARDVLSSKIQDYLDSWINGEKQPTFNQIEKVSKATGIPLGYFFLQIPPDEDTSFVDYRTVDSIDLNNPSRNLIDTMHDMSQIQEWMRNYMIAEGFSKCNYVGRYKDAQDANSFANEIRALLNLNVDWYKTVKNVNESFRIIRSKISDLGTIVMMNGIVENNTHRTLDIGEFRAFTIVDEYAPLIFINANDSMNGRLFSLLHEFAHICIGENSLYNDRFSTGTKVKRAEVICNAVAAEILVPQSMFVAEWKSLSDDISAEKAIDVLARSFRCGQTVIARKAYDNKYIDYNLYQKIAQLAIKLYNESRHRKKEKGESGGNYYTTAASRIDNRFLGLLVSSVQRGQTLYSDAFRLTNTNRSTFVSLVESVGGGML